MGTSLSKEAKFIKGIQEELRSRNIEVKKKDLLKFLLFVHKVCPWFVITCPKIVHFTWDQVGVELTDHFRTHDSEPEKEIMQQYWDLLKSIILSLILTPRACRL